MMRIPLYRGPYPAWYLVAREMFGWIVVLAVLAFTIALWYGIVWALMATFPQ